MKTIQFLLFFILIFPFSCEKDSKEQKSVYVKIDGKTMGTTYHITYADRLKRNLKKKIDELLLEVNMDVSTYIDTAFISLFNKSEDEIPFLNLKDKLGLLTLVYYVSYIR